MTARNPRADATAILPAGYEARVLEPSPPVVTDPPWFADDPCDPSGSDRIVTPIPGEGTTWSSLTDDGARAHASANWLDGRRRLDALPVTFGETRQALHQVAFFALAPKRHAATGKLGLRYTGGGFGTPFFGSDEQVRVEHGLVVHQRAGDVRCTPVTTVRRATAFVGLDYLPVWFDGFHDPLAPADPDGTLDVDAGAATALGDWFGFGTHVLERARRSPEAEEVSRVQLWPEHFDLAFEMGAAARRASYGASPGDTTHPEPYLYVAAWGSIDRGDPYWNDDGFNGASLPYADLLASDDPYVLALSFLDAGRRRLSS